ncbi:MAG TPA: hypothetical protein VMB50_05080 [Myxococcales bacterium]|nr:hypothetical protein [Myxococcales bacterium]
MKTARLLLVLLGPGLLGGCVGVVRDGLPPLVQGCKQNSDCPAPWICADGGCEDWQCQSSCDCPAPADGFGCVSDGEGLSFCEPGKAPSYPCTVDGGVTTCAAGSCTACRTSCDCPTGSACLSYNGDPAFFCVPGQPAGSRSCDAGR